MPGPKCGKSFPPYGLEDFGFAGQLLVPKSKTGEPRRVPLSRRARKEDFCFHDLRHTFASHFAMKGGNIYALAKILGHANPKMTLDRYAHLSPEFIAEQRKVMDRKTYEVASDRHRKDIDIDSLATS